MFKRVLTAQHYVDIFHFYWAQAYSEQFLFVCHGKEIERGIIQADYRNFWNENVGILFLISCSEWQSQREMATFFQHICRPDKHRAVTARFLFEHTQYEI